MTEFMLRINGADHTVTSDPDRSLLQTLREDLDLTGAKYGCGEGACRSCTVLLDGRPTAACVTPLSRADGREIVTIEGLGEDGGLHPVQQAFIDEHAMQCGYCVPGMILTAAALLRDNPDPDPEAIVSGMNGNICRCCNYPNIVRAVERAAALRHAEA